MQKEPKTCWVACLCICTNIMHGRSFLRAPGLVNLATYGGFMSFLLQEYLNMLYCYYFHKKYKKYPNPKVLTRVILESRIKRLKAKL